MTFSAIIAIATRDYDAPASVAMIVF